MISRLASAAMLAAAVVTVVLRAIESEHWRSALAVALAVLGLRLAVMAWRATRRELPWPRLLLPGILWLEGIGLASHASDLLWQVRLGTAGLLELAFVVVAIRELRRVPTSDEPLEARIARSLGALLPPRVAHLAALELVIVGAAFRFLAGGWRRSLPAGFTYHRESGLRMMLPILPLLAIGDLLLLELVILPEAAIWIRVLVHAIAIYGLIWLVGLYASLRARPHRLAGGRLFLHRGILKRLEIPVADIASIAELPSFGDDWKKRAYLAGALRLDVAGGTILELHLRAPVRPIGVLGEGAAGSRVLVAVDDPAAFTAAITP